MSTIRLPAWPGSSESFLSGLQKATCVPVMQEQAQWWCCLFLEGSYFHHRCFTLITSSNCLPKPLSPINIILEVRASTYQFVCACVLSCFSCIQLFATIWSVAHQAPLFMGFSRQEYGSGLPCTPPGDLPDPGMNLCLQHLLHWQSGSLSLCHLGRRHNSVHSNICWLSAMWRLWAHLTSSYNGFGKQRTLELK